MANFGPLRHHSVFRFEAKHALFKRFDYFNFKNLPYSIFERHQLWLLNKLLTDTDIDSYSGIREVEKVDVQFNKFTDDPLYECELLVFNRIT